MTTRSWFASVGTKDHQFDLAKLGLVKTPGEVVDVTLGGECWAERLGDVGQPSSKHGPHLRSTVGRILRRRDRESVTLVPVHGAEIVVTRNAWIAEGVNPRQSMTQEKPSAPRRFAARSRWPRDRHTNQVRADDDPRSSPRSGPGGWVARPCSARTGLTTASRGTFS